MEPATSAQLTIVLTLKDRAPFTYRWMRYMNDVNCPYPILIADGGADEGVETHLRQPEHYPSLRYTYVRYPFDKDYGTFYRKFADAVSSVSTPYLLLADNDDFYLLDTVPDLIRFLEANASFVSCGGNPITLHLMSDDGREVGATSARRYVAYANDKPKSVTAESGIDRLCYFLTNAERCYLWSSWYQVHRTSAVKQAAGFMRGYEFADPVTFEIHMHVCLLLAGKYQAFETPLLVGQVGTSQTTSVLNTAANLVERFIGSGAFADIYRSLDAAAPALSDGDRTRVHQALARWFADQVSLVYPAAPPPNASGALERWMLRTHRSLRRVLGPVERLVRKRPAPPPPLRLPAIERYIVEC